MINLNDSLDSEEIIRMLKDKNLVLNSDYEVRMPKTIWEEITNKLENDSKTNKKSKELLEGYIKLVKDKNSEIERLRKSNEDLYECIKRVPKFIRKIFLKKDIVKLLNK